MVAMRVARSVIAILALAGCEFDVGGSPGPAGSPDARVVDTAPPDAGPRYCKDDPDLVACYRFEFDESESQPLDESTYGNSGTSMDVQYDVGRDGGLAMAFGDLSSVLVPDSASLDVGAITLELWARVDALPAQGGRAGFLDDDGEYGLFLYSDGSVHCAVGGAADDGLVLALATWTHVACTYDGAQIVLYQDGVAGPSVPIVTTIATAPTGGLGIGQNMPDGDHLSGAIDDLRIWRVARTAPEIADDAAGVL